MRDQNQKSWLGAVFGMIFFVSGLAAGYLIAGKMTITYLSSANWQEVSAEIHALELVRNRRSNSTTYKVESNYSYRYKGSTYTNNRTSLSSGSDNISDYWQQLYKTLERARITNEVTALVNPDNPAEAVLDRTFRWTSLIFGMIFLMLFCGIGGFITWASLRDVPDREERLRLEKKNGIASNQKTASLAMAGFGFLLFIVGTGMAAIVLPKALRDGEYAALLILVFVALGLLIIGYAFKQGLAYKRYGPTPLFLDPKVPGIGGQLGGRFELNASALTSKAAFSNTSNLKAQLSCQRIIKSRERSSQTVLWHEEVAVYSKQSARGQKCSFVFNIPDSCQPSVQLDNGTSIRWDVAVVGDLGQTIEKFERTWIVEVEDSAAEKSRITIPQSFQQESAAILSDQAKSSLLEQISVTEDNEYLTVHSSAGRQLGSKIVGMVVGFAFVAAGIATIVDNWWPGYLIFLLGAFIVLSCIHSLGKSIETKIRKKHKVLYIRKSWMGVVYAREQADITKPKQFKIKKTSTTKFGNKITEHYALNFEVDSKKSRIAEGIEGKKAAQVLKATIVKRIFDENEKHAHEKKGNEIDDHSSKSKIADNGYADDQQNSNVV